MEYDPNKAFSSLNADEVKIGSKGYFADDLQTLMDCCEQEAPFATLQFIANTSEEYRFIADCKDMAFNLFYLVEEPKKEKYRPYKDSNEMIEDFKSRAGYYSGVSFFSENPMLNISIWVKNKKRTAKSLIYVFYPRSVYVGDEEEMTLDKLFEYYTYLDGTPCGKKL
jgi:hypothetical protein